MAKVQEAKEIPTVKVLDAANTPDKKSFPPRLLIIFICTTCVFVAAACWIFAKTAWNDTNPNDARKVFAQEVYTTMLAQLPQFERNDLESHRERSFWGSGRGQSTTNRRNTLCCQM
jgi:hypothetical protein